jgi:hypothetical protein
MMHMAKTKKTPTEQPQPTGRAPVLNLRLGHEREAAIATFIARQKVKPDKTAFVLAAVDKMLEEEGLWPPQG